MDNYLEYSVAGERGPREQIAYGACWALVVLLGLAAIFFAVSILAPGEDGAHINWLSVALMVVCAVLAVLAYRRKDKVYREYDYILWNSELEVHAVYNRRSRKKLASIPVDKVSAWGPLAAMEARHAQLRKRVWCVHPAQAWGLAFPVEGGREMAVVELSAEMCAQIRAISVALRTAEVKP